MSLFIDISYEVLSGPTAHKPQKKSPPFPVQSQDFVHDVITWGWVKSFRKSKTCSFAHIHQGDSHKSLQIILSRKLFAGSLRLAYGSFIQVTGRLQLVETSSKKVELHATQVKIPTDQTGFPLQPKEQSLLFLRDHCHLRARTALFQSIFRLKSTLFQGLHHYFVDSGYCLVQSPVLTQSDCEGAGEVFTVDSQEFFGQKAMLSVSAQLELEALCLGLGKVYSLAPCFRKDPSDTPRHTCEFWMLEAEISGIGYEHLIQEIQDLFRAIPTMLACATSELQVIGKKTGYDFQNAMDLLQRSYEKISFAEAIQILRDHDKVTDLYQNKDLSADQERFLADIYFKSPIMITHYPKQMRAFYSKLDSSKQIAFCTDLILPGTGEVLSGGIREDNLDLLQTEMASRGMTSQGLEKYLDLRRWGSAPHGGYGVGIDRLMMYLTEMASIRDLQPYPRAWKAFY